MLLNHYFWKNPLDGKSDSSEQRVGRVRGSIACDLGWAEVTFCSKIKGRRGNTVRQVKTLASTAVSVAAALIVGLGTIPAVTAATLPIQWDNLVALGDSITFGYNLSDTDNNTVSSASAYPTLIGKDEHYTVSNLGIPGWTSADLLNALATPSFTRAIQGASVVSIDIGSNDLLETAESLGLLEPSNLTASSIQLTPTETQAFQTALVQFGINMTEIVMKVRAETKAPIILYNLYNPIPSQVSLSAITEQYESYENQTIAMLASMTPNTVLADAHSAFENEQMTYVRVAELDVHPTVLGQTALAQVGEKALLTLKSQIKSSTSPVTTMVVGDEAGAGGSITGDLQGTQVSLTIPSQALNQESEVDVTSQGSSAIPTSLLPKGMKVITEESLNYQAGVAMQSPYSLVLDNPLITSGAKVYTVTNAGLKPFTGAKVTAGKVTITSKLALDFVVLQKIGTSVKKH